MILLKYHKRVIHLIIESFVLFVGGVFISSHINSLFVEFDEEIFNNNDNKYKYWYLLFEIFIQLTLLLFVAVLFKDNLKNFLANLLDHSKKNVSLLSNIPFTPALFSYQTSLIKKLHFLLENFLKLF